MVRPNQIIRAEGSELTFLMFARSEKAVKRRVVILNFPGKALSNITDADYFNKVVTNVKLQTEGMVNRYQVTIDTEKL